MPPYPHLPDLVGADFAPTEADCVPHGLSQRDMVPMDQEGSRLPVPQPEPDGLPVDGCVHAPVGAGLHRPHKAGIRPQFTDDEVELGVELVHDRSPRVVVIVTPYTRNNSDKTQRINI